MERKTGKKEQSRGKVGLYPHQAPQMLDVKKDTISQ
jgi:hypothetical protein